MLRSLSIVTDAFRSGDQVIFPPAERIKALAGFGVTAVLGTVSGPLLGGLLTQHSLLGLGWRSIFLINVPVGIIAAWDWSQGWPSATAASTSALRAASSAAYRSSSIRSAISSSSRITESRSTVAASSTPRSA